VNDLKRLSVYIITGGGSGLGKALAVALAERGQSVLIVGRRLNLLKETASHSALIDYFCADISLDEGITSLKQHVESVPHISGLVNNAGTLKPITPLLTMSTKEWHKTLNTNVDAALFLPQNLYTKLCHGRVLNIGSGAAYFAIKGWAAYCVSKAALSMLTQCWQLESEDVAFASVMPGIVDTDMQTMAREGINMDEEQTGFYKNLKETNRLIPANTVAQFLVWLLLDLDNERYKSREWDIYDTSHHEEWLRPPHQVIHWEA
jgi:NAD(P)-dependent dehydrogenase (short-subunit alcohol dehydrogenase family)